MYIEELNIRSYGRLSNVRLEPAHGLNVIHGPAGAGKTSVCNCLRDLLLGPGRWDSPQGGPRCPYARPWSGDRFQARLRYSIGPSGFTLLRDFDDMSARARDDNAGKEIPMPDARAAAPGLVPFHLDDDAPPEEADEGQVSERRLVAARGRVEAASKEAAASEWRYSRALLSDLEARLRKSGDLQNETQVLQTQMAQREGFANVGREHRDAVIRTSARLHALEREVADGQKMLEGLLASRRDVGTRLSAYERFYSVTEADLEMVKTLDLAEGPSLSQVEEKEKNLAGFLQQEADIKRRLEEIAPRFETAGSDDDFDMRLNEHERELGRSELLTSKIVERDRLQGQIDPTKGSSKRFLLFGTLILVAGLLLLGLWFATRQSGLLMAALIAGLLSVPVLMKKSIEDARLRELESDSGRVLGDIEKLKVTIDASREQVRVMLEAAGVQTIKDLRTLHRELRSLQRDAETVRAYRRVLESDLEAARQKSTGRRVETPPLLVECGVLKPGEVPTPRAVADFFEAYHKFKALQQEEDGLKMRLSELQASLAAKSAEQASLREAHTSALESMGLQSESEMEAAFAGKREYDRAKAELDVLNDKLRSVMRGLDVVDATAQVEAMRVRLGELERLQPEVGLLEVSPEKLEEYRAKLQQAQHQVSVMEGEMAALESGQAPLSAGPAEVGSGTHPQRLERHLAQAWLQVTGRATSMRVSHGQGRLQIEVRETDEGPWLPSAMMGSVSARLIDVLVEGESARLAGLGGLPAFFDNPFALLDPTWQERLVGWLIDLSEKVQVFVTLSTPDERDRIREAIATHGMAVSELHEGGLEILTAAHAVGVAG